ncbi:hypothetical protein PRIPAC_94473 [Pristionchus pacificus]|uniref:Uncharacterized protein n=1 Tax=Pristionchus pacificus TaxID=54126 RepID=A0A454Y154_PRIPA|nr:hypothetical protein PRIPAC_94473 [Pristionchus pacificus]|eukprot:PDM67727.1 hypothetical protein PRIPAC_45771 [Pristionchus pacificus]
MYLPIFLLVLLFSFDSSSALRGGLLRQGRSVQGMEENQEIFDRAVRAPLRPFRSFDGYYMGDYYNYPPRQRPN